MIIMRNIYIAPNPTKLVQITSQFKTRKNIRFRFRFRFRFFIHQVLQQGKCLESGKHTNISKQQH